MSDKNIEEEAWKMIKQSNGKGLLMIGLTFPHKDPTMSPPVPSKCDICGEPAYSTKLKEKIKELTLGSAQLLCGKCLHAYSHKH